MKLDIGGSEVVGASIEALWEGLNDPAVLTRCIPGCRGMTQSGPDTYKVELHLRVAAVGGSFEGEIALSDKEPPAACRISVSGAGTLGHGNGLAQFQITGEPDGQARLTYQGTGEVGGLVAGVGQRILASVSKHLIARFFKALRKEFEIRQTSADDGCR